MNDTPIDPHPDIMGRTYGKITVIEFEGFKEIRGVLNPVYITKCMCGHTRKAIFSRLKEKGMEPCLYCKANIVKSKQTVAARAARLKKRLAEREKQKKTGKERRVANLAKQYREREAAKEAQRDEKQRAARKEAALAAARSFKGDLTYVTQMLLNDREFNRTGRVAHEDGEPDEPTPIGWRPDGRAVVQATQTLASIHGLVTKRTEVTIVNTIEKMRDDELVDFINKLKEKLDGYQTIELNSARPLPLIEQTEPEIIGYEEDE